MPLDPNVLLNWPFEDIVTTYTERDAILYALGLGPVIERKCQGCNGPRAR